jgi:eukaryotic-like serine/threonine-protein kinase
MTEARLGGRYVLLEPIGLGGMAVVWRGRDVRLARDVAVKILRSELAADPAVVERFETEARHAGGIAHQNIVAVFDVGTDGADHYIVMELVAGPTLGQVLAQEGLLPPSEAARIAISAAEALAAAHTRGIVHRDIKPGNLLLDREGRVRLTDFGIAKALATSSVTTPGTILGSVPYISPEQARGEEATAASDQFSLGVVLFEMLTGQLPWSGDSFAATAAARLHAIPPAVSEVARGVPPELDGIVDRALQSDPDGRFPDVTAFSAALHRWRDGAEGSHRGSTAMTGPDDETRVGLAAIGGAGAAAAAGAPGSAGRAPGGATAGAAGPAAGNAAGFARSGPGRGGRPGRGSGAARRSSASPGGSPPNRIPPRRGRAGGSDARRNAGIAILGIALFTVLVGGAALAGLIGQELPDRGAIQVPGGVETSPDPSPPAEATPAEATPDAAAEPTPPATATPPPAIVTPPPPDRVPATPAEPPTTTPAAPVTDFDRPQDAVRAFYDAVVAGDWELATAMWSPDMQEEHPPGEYIINRFANTTEVEIVRMQVVDLDEDDGEATVAVELVEHRSTGTSPRRFLGSWDLVWLDGAWLLDDPDF